MSLSLSSKITQKELMTKQLTATLGDRRRELGWRRSLHTKAGRGNERERKSHLFSKYYMSDRSTFTGNSTNDVNIILFLWNKTAGRIYRYTFSVPGGRPSFTLIPGKISHLVAWGVGMVREVSSEEETINFLRTYK